MPIAVHFLASSELSRLELEPMVTKLAFVLIVILFYGHMFALSWQYISLNPDKGLLFMTEKQLAVAKQIEEQENHDGPAAVNA